MDTLERFNAALAYIETHLDGVIDGNGRAFVVKLRLVLFVIPPLSLRYCA